MADDERLREALLELKVLREREAASLKETNALLSGLESLSSAPTPEAAIASLLASVQDTLDGNLALVFRWTGEAYEIAYASTPAALGAQWAWSGLAERPRRIVDLKSVTSLADSLPRALTTFRAMISVPLPLAESAPGVLACFAFKNGHFSRHDANLLTRFSQMATQVLDRQALERRNAFLATVIEESSTSVAVADATRKDLPLVYVNRAFEGLTGYRRDEVIGRNCRFLSAEAPESRVRGDIRRTVALREAGEFLLRNTRKDGAVFWNELRLFPIRDSDGQALQMVATQTDATQRVQAEKQRDAARRRLEAALASTSDGFLLIAGDGRILFVNAPYRELFGARRGIWTEGARFSEAWQTFLDMTGAVEGPAAEFGEAACSRPESLELALPNGQYVILNSRPVADGGAVVTTTDITRVKMAEQLLRQRAAAVENALDGIAIADRSGRLLYANPAALTMWGVGEAKALGRRWTAFYAHPEMASLPARIGRKLARDGFWREELPLKDADAGRHDLSLTWVAEVGTVIIARDITERLNDEAERARLRKQLEQAQLQEVLGQVAAGLAHDFNNLLSAITGSANLIGSEPDIQPQIRRAADRIVAAGDRAAGLVNQLLDFGAREKLPETHDLREVLSEAAELLEGSLRRETAFTVRLGEETAEIVATQTDILQVVMNLVLNAQDAMGLEGGEIGLTLALGEPPKGSFDIGRPQPGTQYARITVEDTGSGMTAETRENVFKPYFTTKGDKGTGLGLAVVTHILSLNHCLLALWSEPGAGTRFDIYWPLGAAKTNRAIEAVDQVAPVSLAGRTILLVDDDPGVAQVFAAVLEKAGAEVAVTEDPELALEALTEDPGAWSCLVTDYDMPGMTGGDLAEAARTHDPTLPVVVVSALARRLSDPRVAEGQVAALLAKPVDPVKLAETIGSAIAAADTERETG